jgi:hypothetical protein
MSSWQERWASKFMPTTFIECAKDGDGGSRGIWGAPRTRSIGGELHVQLATGLRWDAR